MKTRWSSSSTSCMGCSCRCGPGRRRRTRPASCSRRHKALQDRYPWHQLQLPGPKAYLTYVPPIGPLPRDWKWGADFLPALLRWLTRLMWLPPKEGPPQGQSQVSFMELVLDFESHASH